MLLIPALHTGNSKVIFHKNATILETTDQYGSYWFAEIVIVFKTVDVLCENQLPLKVTKLFFPVGKGTLSAQGEKFSHFTVCFLDRWPQTKCKVTFEHLFLIQFL